MDGVSDAAFRLTVAQHGKPDVMFTEFTSVGDICRGPDFAIASLRYDETERPIVAQLYGKETSIQVKKQILQAMFVGGDATRLIELARTEPNPELRRTAVRNLGLIGSQRTGTALVELYAKDNDPEIKRAVIQALFIQNNAESLVALARKEPNTSAMKREMVQKLALMQNKVAKDYMLELLK